MELEGQISEPLHLKSYPAEFSSKSNKKK